MPRWAERVRRERLPSGLTLLVHPAPLPAAAVVVHVRAGFLDEVRALRARFRLTERTPSIRAVGYRQAWEHLERRTTFEEMRLRALAATRQLAKRQTTWLRSFRDVAPVPPDLARLAHSFL